MIQCGLLLILILNYKFYFLITHLESILPNVFLPKTKIFFCFLLLSLAISMYIQYFPMLQTLKLNAENLKKWRNQSFVGLTPVVSLFWVWNFSQTIKSFKMKSNVDRMLWRAAGKLNHLDLSVFVLLFSTSLLF